MPVYVPCPINASVSLDEKVKSSWRTTDSRTGKVTTGSYTSSACTVFTGTRTGVGGPKIKLKDTWWAPTRPYARGASRFTYFPGNSRETNGANLLREWTGVPHSGGVWSYDANMPSYSTFADNLSCTLTSGWVPTMSNNMLNRLKTELLVKAARRQVNWGETLGESKSTAKMLISAAMSLTRAALAARKGRWGLVARHLGVRRIREASFASKSTANKWLAYQYGWAPLMSDIYDSYNFLKQGFEKKPHILKCVRSIRENAEFSVGSDAYWKNKRSSATARYQACMWYRLSDDWIAQAHQIGMINPAEVAWALVPFSFVFDWLMPVGDYLEALSARATMTFVDGYYGVSVETTHTNSGMHRSSAGYSIIGLGTQAVTRQTYGYRRTKMSSMPWPGLYIKSPFSTTHLVSALALIRQLWRR